LKTNFLKRFALAAVAALMIAGGTQARAGLVLTADAAGVQSSTVAGVTTENFNEFSTGHYSSLTTAVGTLSTTGHFAIVEANEYGGAGGAGNYFSVGAQSGSAAPVTLTLNGAQTYFGIWWSAGDAENVLRFYSGATLLGTYTTASALGSLSSAYNGNTNNRSLDPGEKFAYLNFIGTSGTTFNKIVFSNSGTTSTGFESDNWSVTASVPEPSSLVLAGTALAMGALVHLRRRRRLA